MADLSEVLKKRLRQQGKTKYALAKAMAQADGTGKSVTNFSTKVNNIIENPEDRIFSGVREVVEMLGGEIIIRWTNTDDEIIS